ncbi:MAG: methyltransferase [Chitinophagaceae bacterium]|nr:methyltransferase [Chitinophagaceae bacterium]
MANSYFRFKQFTIHQDRCAMKVTTDACLFGAWAAEKAGNQKPGTGSILDIGTGTGLLSLMLAQKINAYIDAVEIDKEAAEQAAENVIATPWKERINIITGDVMNENVLPAKKYDSIISNPPFYENELTSENNRKNIAHHNEGLLLHELLNVIKRKLDTNGRFYLLLPYKRLTEAALLIQKHQLAAIHIAFVKQSTQHDHFRIIVEGKHAVSNDTLYTKSEISVWNDQQQYTPEFIELLKEYYLYL